MIKIQNITKSYEGVSGKSTVLDQLNLKVEKGRWSTIIGPSGSGKTTLLKCISGLLKPDNGCIYYHDKNIYALSEKDRSDFRRNNIGFIFQDFKLLPYYSVIDNVILPLIMDMPKKELYKKAADLLTSVGIKEELFSRLPEGLSGGEKQRVAIARSLIGNPDVLICDEPTGNLDLFNRDNIIHIFHELKERDLTIVVVTHDMEVAKHGDFIYEMSQGQLYESGIYK